MDSDQKSLNPEEFQELMNQLPKYVHDAMMDIETGKKNTEIAKKYSLDNKQLKIFIKTEAYAFVKKTLLPEIPSVLISNGFDPMLAKNITVDMLNAIFLPLRHFFTDTENSIKNLGGQLIDPLPPALGDKEPLPAPKIGKEPIAEKDIMYAIESNQDVANQILTDKPIKFADSENLKMPSIKNWLLDYRRFRNTLTNQDFSLARAQYLHENVNAKILGDKERNLLSLILKSYDERELLPFSQKTGLLMIDMLVPQDKPASGRGAPPPQQTQPVQPQPLPQKPIPQPSGQKDMYREKVSDKDVAGPEQPMKRPEPRIDGNTINLREFGEK